jgi:hypothetical protein
MTPQAVASSVRMEKENINVLWLIDWLIIYCFTSRSRIFHIWYGDVTITGEGLQNFGLCSALRAFEQGGIFIVPHLLWHGPRFFLSHPKDHPIIQSPLTTRKGCRRSILTRILTCPLSVASYKQGNAEDLFLPGSPLICHANCYFGIAKHGYDIMLKYSEVDVKKMHELLIGNTLIIFREHVSQMFLWISMVINCAPLTDDQVYIFFSFRNCSKASTREKGIPSVAINSIDRLITYCFPPPSKILQL